VFNDTGLTAATTYSYTVGVANSNGSGPQGPAFSASTPVFNFANFSGSPTVHVNETGAIVGGNIRLTDGTSHHGSGVFENTAQDITSFTTEYVFSMATGGNGFVFTCQNATSATNPGNFGVTMVSCSANGIGYGAGGGSTQPATANSIGLVCSTSPFNQATWFISPAPISTCVLCVDGGPAIGGGPFGGTNGNGYAAAIDTHPLGINFSSNNPIHAVVTYDGTILTVVFTDTVTAATTRLSWPINIPACVGSNTALVGFFSNTPLDTAVPPANATNVNFLYSWKWSHGINTRLATPTFSVAPGQYASTQSVSLSGQSGATLYYTTNGLPPTPGGVGTSQYIGTPISVSASQYIQAVAVQSGFTDSSVAQVNYQIQASSSPVINFPSGFASANGLIQPVGNARISGSNIVLTDTLHGIESAAAWFAPQVSVGTFSTTFTLNVSSVSGSNIGFCFVLQNYPQTNTGTNLNWSLGNGPFGVTMVTGGPYTLTSPANGQSAGSLGYVQIFNSIGIVFNITGNSVGLYTNGAFPGGSQTAITGVSLSASTPIRITISYNGTALTLTMTQGANTFGLTLSSSINIPSIVGASTAWAGFSAATANFGSAFANMNVSNWTM
jgi:hypothetical protein